MDWKEAIDKKEQRKREAVKRKESLERLKNLRQLGNRFKCHVCGYRAQKPSKGWHSYYDGPGQIGVDFPVSAGHKTDDWSKPADLYRCYRCKKWTCDECRHEGICQKCGEKIARKMARRRIF